MEQTVRARNKQIIGLSGKVLLALACIVDSAALLLMNTSRGYRFLFLLPLSYMAAYFLFTPLIQKTCNYRRGYPYLVAQFVIAYRYLALPLACVYTDTFGGWTITGANGFGVEPGEAAMTSATLWMCTEVFIAELALYIGTRITRKKETRRLRIEQQYGCQSQKVTFLSSKVVLILYSICAFALLFLFQRQLFSQFLVLSDDYALGDNAASGSFYKVIFFALRIALLMLGYALCAKHYQNSRKKGWILLAMMFLVIYIGYSIGVSRWNLILPVIASIDLCRDLFKPFPKSLLAGVVCVAVIGVFSISFFKYGYLIVNSSNPLRSMIALVFQQSNEYISGPRSVAQGLEMLQRYGNRVSISTFFNSMFSGFAGLSGLTNEADKLGSLFNLFCTGKLQDKPLICPIIIEGLAFFPLFPWMFMMSFQVLMCIMDHISQTTGRYEMRFLAGYMGLWFALCFALNTKIEMSQISQMLAIWFLFEVNTKIRLAKS